VGADPDAGEGGCSRSGEISLATRASPLLSVVVALGKPACLGVPVVFYPMLAEPELWSG
jgi:hypothetical protein